MQYSPKTGDVFVRNYDQGVVERLGGTVQTITNHPTMGTRRGYWVDITAANPITVPIIFSNPEQVYEKKILPSFIVSRDSIEPALQRWHSVKQLEYIQGVSGTEEVIAGVSGYGQVESKVQAYPYDLFYTIFAYARYEHEAVPMLKQILRQFPPYSRIKLIDSLGTERRYTVFAESGVQDIGEYVDIADRTKAFSYSFRVEGELDLIDPMVRSTLAGIDNSVGIL